MTAASEPGAPTIKWIEMIGLNQNLSNQPILHNRLHPNPPRQTVKTQNYIKLLAIVFLGLELVGPAPMRVL